jgi:PTH1 family peptidyl-tRNA hydrolase
LGNPGNQYQNTRHNVGFMVGDELARRGATTFSFDQKWNSDTARTGGRTLMKPQTFMNRSGLATVALARFYKVMPDEILVVHDELDLPPGTVKLKLGGGSGGHNGLKDIAAHLTTQQFWRLRLGIGHPRNLLPPGTAPSGQHDVANFVLKAPRKEEQDLIDRAIDRSLDALPDLIAGNAEKSMMRLHTAG